MSESANITTITHPEYDAMTSSWSKWRSTYTGGTEFVKQYLEKFSIREDMGDFESRRSITYCPAHAKSAVKEIKNSIFQRISDVTRRGGSVSYQNAIIGKERGVDRQGSTMSGFIGRTILDELLTMAKVGVYVDAPDFSVLTKADEQLTTPYLYTYRTEDIRSWAYDPEQNLTSLLLRDHTEVIDRDTGLVTSISERYRLYRKTMDGILVTFYNAEGAEISNTVLELLEIPFVLFEISESLLTDVADYQVALLNMESSDLNYSLKSNFPFYTEQFNPASDMPFVRQATATSAESELAGEASSAARAKDNQIKVGVTKGRRYPQGLERPGFIHPSSEPLKASMEKEANIKVDIRSLVSLSVANLNPVRASDQSKAADDRGLEAGLSAIGLELEYGESLIGKFWSAYEKAEQPTIKYPDRYSLRSDADRRLEASELEKLKTQVPSGKFQKAVCKEIATVLVGSKISHEELDDIHDEIDKAEVIVTDPSTLKADHDAGFVGTKLASKLRGYPEGEVENAKTDHADRLARIAISQSEGAAAARGITDQAGDSEGGVKEKVLANLTDNDDVAADKTRGDAK